MQNDDFFEDGRGPWAKDALCKHVEDEIARKELLEEFQQGLQMLDSADKASHTKTALLLTGSERPQSLLFFLRWLRMEGEESPAELANCMGVSRSTVTREWRDKGVELFIQAFAALLLHQLDPHGADERWQHMRAYVEKCKRSKRGRR